MKRRRHPYRAPRRSAPPAPKPAASQRTTYSSSARPRYSARGTAASEEVINVNLLRVLVCGVIFVSLVTLKLLLPGSLAGVRGTLGSWLVRDADFAAAFSAVGHAVSGEGGVLDSLENAYVAVFGEQEEEAKEVSAAEALDESTDAGAPPDAETAPEAQATPIEEEAPPEGDTVEGGASKEETASDGEQPDVDLLPEHASAQQRILGFDYVAPITGTVTSNFGWRVHPKTGREAFHYGVDIGAEEGADIVCFSAGKVGVVGESTELGKYLTIYHENGISTLYAHCSKVTATSGSSVEMGEKIAEVGSTGNATGPHLHFEVHNGEEYLDPIYYLS